MRIEGNNYYIETHKKKDFQANNVADTLINQSIDFAYNMSFGEGFHRGVRSGGQYSRKPSEIFCNTFQGKLAEYVLRQYLEQHDINNLSDVDSKIMDQGKWDDTDLKANGYTINIKSAAHFSNLILLETKDWNQKGEYIPNLNNGSTYNYDFFVLVRINPDIKRLFKNKRWLYSESLSQRNIENHINNQTWEYDLPGYIKKDNLAQAIKNKQVIPQNVKLNGKVNIDAENYYFEIGDLHPMITFLDEINKKL